jgi:hypothetical protein
VGWSIEEQSDPFVHNCSSSCALEFRLHFGHVTPQNFKFSNVTKIHLILKLFLVEKNLLAEEDSNLFRQKTIF